MVGTRPVTNWRKCNKPINVTIFFTLIGFIIIIIIIIIIINFCVFPYSRADRRKKTYYIVGQFHFAFILRPES